MPLPDAARLLDISPDGSLLALGGDDSGVLVVERPGAGGDGESADEVAAGCRLAGRNLSEVEWSRYLPDREYRRALRRLRRAFRPRRGDRGARRGPREPAREWRGAAGGVGEVSGESTSPSPMSTSPTRRTTWPAWSEARTLRDGTAFDSFGATADLVDTFLEDMTGDGVTDAVVTSACTAGTGVLHYVVVVDGAAPPGQIKQVSDALMTRELVRVDAGSGVVREPDYAPDDPQCCPSGFEKHTWVLQNGTWVER